MWFQSGNPLKPVNQICTLDFIGVYIDVLYRQCKLNISFIQMATMVKQVVVAVKRKVLRENKLSPQWCITIQTKEACLEKSGCLDWEGYGDW